MMERMDIRAMNLVREYIGTKEITYDVFIVWKCKTIQNWKYIIGTTIPDGSIYELTYNGDMKEWYLDHYIKAHKETIKEP